MSKRKKYLANTEPKKTSMSGFISCHQIFIKTTDLMDGATRVIPMEESIFGFDYSEEIATEEMNQIFDHDQLGMVLSIHT